MAAFAKYAWAVLGYNLLVILWGVFLRASKSGDGCGQHWLTCGGEVVPSAPEMKTVIEFTHRLMSAADGIIVIILVVWAVKIYRRERTELARFVKNTAIISFIFVLIEGALGGGLVLTGNTAETLTPARPFWMSAHLLNTLILLLFFTVTAWAASTGKQPRLTGAGREKWVLAGGIAVLFVIGISGSIAALSSMIFPSGTIAEGIAKDFSETSHVLLRLRLFHPLTAIFGTVAIYLLAGWLKRRYSAALAVGKWADRLSILLLVQLAFGAATLLMLGPIVMQLGHLFLADLVWLAFIILAFNVVTSSPSEPEPTLN